MDPPQNVLVTPRGESAATTYLLYDGRRGQGRPAQSRRRPCIEAGGMRSTTGFARPARCLAGGARNHRTRNHGGRHTFDTARVRRRYRDATDSHGFRRVLRRARGRCPADRRGCRRPHQVHPTARPARHRGRRSRCDRRRADCERSPRRHVSGVRRCGRQSRRLHAVAVVELLQCRGHRCAGWKLPAHRSRRHSGDAGAGRRAGRRDRQRLLAAWS